VLVFNALVPGEPINDWSAKTMW